jgi:hypothetical protein
MERYAIICANRAPRSRRGWKRRLSGTKKQLLVKRRELLFGRGRRLPGEAYLICTTCGCMAAAKPACVESGCCRKEQAAG